MRTYQLRALLFICFLVTMSPVFALSNSFPSRDEVNSRLEILNSSSSLTPEDKLVKNDLMHTLEFMDKIDAVAQESNELEKQPEKIQNEINNLLALNNANIILPELGKLQSLSIPQLENLLNQVTARLQIAQENSFSYTSQLVSQQILPERAQSVIYDLTQQQVTLQNQLNDLSSSNKVRETERIVLVNQLNLLSAQRALEFKKLGINTQLTSLLKKQVDYITAYINKLQKVVSQLQGELNTKRFELSKNILADERIPENVKKNQLVNKELDANYLVGKRLNLVTNSTNQLVQKNIQVRNWLNSVQESQSNLAVQINMFRGTLLLSRLLYQQQQDFQSDTQNNNLSLKIEKIKIEKFDISHEINQIFNPGPYVDNLLNTQSPEDQSSEVRDILNKIVSVRLTLLEQLNEQLGSQLAQSIKLQTNQQQLDEINTEIRRTLAQQIFWVSSNKSMNFYWFLDFPEAVKQQFSNIDIKIHINDLIQGVKDSASYLLLIFLGIVVISWRMRNINKDLNVLSDNVGHFSRDNQLNTPKAIYFTLVKALPGALIILAIGLVGLKSNTIISQFCWRLSLDLSLFWFCTSFIWHSLAPKGIVESHFVIPAKRCIQFRRKVILLSLTLLPIVFWSVLGEQNPLWLMNDVIGQVIIFTTLILLCVQMMPICRSHMQSKSSFIIKISIAAVIGLVPIIFILLMGLGYFYTTLRLASRWIDSLYLLIAWDFVFLTTIRGLSLAAQKLAYRRAIARRRELAKEGNEDDSPIEEPQLAIDQINRQSLRMINMLFFMIFALFFYWIWSDLIVDLSYLYGITLWNYNEVVAGTTVSQSVTLGSLLVCLTVLIVSYIMMRNLPGLLEVLVLSRLQLRPGTSYAITSVLTYLIVVIGVMIALGRLGISWNKLQWLAAALSVGLGFGLQEILANFVSGLIILFERPIRIGDTITIGTYSGKVSKIHIRATTIIDFDRKEVIVPNKSFVTERLINWTLSDTVTRVSIKLGVAYGSDLDKVREVLLAAAKQNSYVLADPEPQVLFLSFGDSTLDHELRFYVGELKYRNRTIDELNRAIDALCRQNNIDIAYNQLEVYLHNPQSGESVEVDSTVKKPSVNLGGVNG